MNAQEKVLVVDDEPSIRKYLQTLLEVDGFEVETLSSGREAIKQISEGKRPDFVILDVLMPEMKRNRHAERADAAGPFAERNHVVVLERSGTVVESDSNRRARLPDQTVREIGAGCGDVEVAAKEGIGDGESGAAGLLRSGDRGFKFPGGQPADGQDSQQILQIAPVDVPVFVCGESGVGKRSCGADDSSEVKRRNQPL